MGNNNNNNDDNGDEDDKGGDERAGKNCWMERRRRRRGEGKGRVGCKSHFGKRKKVCKAAVRKNKKGFLGYYIYNNNKIDVKVLFFEGRGGFSFIFFFVIVFLRVKLNPSQAAQNRANLLNS